MEQFSENRQSDNPAEVMAASLGRTLRDARERLGLSVADVANQTKLAIRQIEALEADDLRRLPQMPFVRGFVRSYAKILKLEPQPLLAFLPQPDADSAPLTLTSVEVPFPNAHTPQRQNLIWLGAALLLAVLVVAFAVWNFTVPPEKTAKAEAPPAQVETPVSLPAGMQIIPAESGVIAIPDAASSPLAAVPAVQAPQQIQPVTPVAQPLVQNAKLRLTFDDESWTEIRDKDGRILSSQSNPRGSELLLNGQSPFLLVIGHAASVKLYHRGKQVDLTPHINASSDVARLTLE